MMHEAERPRKKKLRCHLAFQIYSFVPPSRYKLVERICALSQPLYYERSTTTYRLRI